MLGEADIHNHQLNNNIKTMWYFEPSPESSRRAFYNNTYSSTVNITTKAMQENNFHILNYI